VAAEVARLEALGAKRVRQVKNWWVMEDPGGHRFCVVPGPSTRIGRKARSNGPDGITGSPHAYPTYPTSDEEKKWKTRAGT
jgi:hypothetical protein